MERLTNKREADAQRRDYENRIKNGYPRNIPEERVLRLAAYEDTKMPPELVEKVAKFAMWVNENGSDRLRHLAEADEENRIIILPSKESRKKLQEAFNIVVKYGFCSDCVQKYDGTLCHQCDCFQNGVDVIRRALFGSVLEVCEDG